MSKGKGSGGPRLGGQFAPGGGRIGKTGRKPRPKDPKAQARASKHADSSKAWAKKSAEFHAKARTAKTPLERKAYLTAAKKASAKAGEHAKEASSFVGKKHPIAQRAQAHAGRASERDKKRADHDSAKEQRTQARAAERDKRRGEREEKQWSDKTDRAKARAEGRDKRTAAREDKQWNQKVERYKAKAERLDAKERATKKRLEEKKAAFWEKKKTEFEHKAHAAKTPVEHDSLMKAAHAAGGHAGDSLAWVHALAQIGGAIKDVMLPG